MKAKLFPGKTIVLFFVLLIASCITEPETYTIIFNGNGATGIPPASISFKENEPHQPLPEEGELIYEGMTFYGWNTKADGTGTLYSVGWTLIKGNTTLYAQWTDLGAIINLRYSFGDGIILNFDGVGDLPKLEDYQGNPEMMWDRRTFIAYVLFRNYTVFPGGFTNYNSNGFEPHMFDFTTNFRDTRWDLVYGGTFEYFIAICRIIAKVHNEFGYEAGLYDYDIIVGPHSDVVSLEIRGDGTPLAAPKGFRAVLYETSNGSTAVQLNWKEVPRAYGYRLYYSYDDNNYNNVEGNTVTVLHRTNYTDYIPEGRTVYYKVTAVNNMMENGYFSDPVIPKLPNMPNVTFEIVLKNNYASAISRAYTRDIDTNSWGNNLTTSPIVTNNSALLGVFKPDYYEIMTESVIYYRINTGTNDRGLNITGGILDGYQPIYYLQPKFDLTQDITITVPATGWTKIKPE